MTLSRPSLICTAQGGGDIWPFLTSVHNKHEELAAVGIAITWKDYQCTVLKGIPKELAKFAAQLLSLASINIRKPTSHLFVMEWAQTSKKRPKVTSEQARSDFSQVWCVSTHNKWTSQQLWLKWQNKINFPMINYLGLGFAMNYLIFIFSMDRLFDKIEKIKR